MRVFCDATVIRPPLTGVQLSVRHEVVALADAVDRGLVVGTLDVRCGELIQERGHTWMSLPGACRNRGLRILWQQLWLPGVLRSAGVDVLHAFAYTAPHECPVPYVLNVHDTIALDHPELCARANVWHMRTLLPGSIRRAAAVVVSSSSVADRVVAGFDKHPDTVHVVPLGVEFAQFATSRHSAAADPVPACEGRPYVLFVGNLEPKKGLDVLLDAWEGALARTELDLVICGRPAWRCGGIVRWIRELEAGGRVHWVADAPDEQMPGLYAGAMCCVVPSRVEGFGLTVLESMAAGTPVVHSNHTVLLETAGGAGLPFVNGDPESLACGVMELLRSPAMRDELNEKGRERAEAMSWRRWANSVSQIYQALSPA